MAMLGGLTVLSRSMSAAFAAMADSAAGPTSTPAPPQAPGPMNEHEGTDGNEGDDGVPAKPGAPTVLSATRSASGEITVSWTEPGSSGSRAITGYQVDFETETQASSCTSSVTGWDDASATAGAAGRVVKKSGLGSNWYCVRVFASNGVTSGPTNYAYAGPVFAEITKPEAPTGVAAVRSAKGDITVSWTAPGDNGGSAVTGYVIGYESDSITSSSTCDSSSGNYANAADSGSSGAVTERKSGLSADWYCIRIAADNAASGSLKYAYSGPVYAGAVKPDAPTGVSAVKSGTNEIRVSWTAPTDNGGSAITSYPIGYEKDGVTPSTVCGPSTGDYTDKKDTGAADKTSEKQNGLTSGWYCVRIAADNSGTGSLSYAYAGPVNAG